MAMSSRAGVDVRTVWAREAKAARGVGRRHFSAVSDEVDSGGPISDGLKTTGEYFPDFFRQLVHVGESTGHLPEVYRQLAEHYEHQLKLRRSFLSALTWPLIELTIALAVVGLVIWLMGAIPALKNNKTDIFGFGLTGTSGLMTYLTFLAMVAAAGFFVYRATVRGVLWVAPVQRAIMRIPRLGRALETLAMARLAWAMHVTLNSGMDLRPAMQMSLRSTRNALYTQHIDRVLRAIRAGQEIHEALGETKAFPVHFLDAVRVGEESGQLVESIESLSAQYQDEAKLAMDTLTTLLGVAVTGLIGGIIIFLIFRAASFYIGVINDAVKMRR